MQNTLLHILEDLALSSPNQEAFVFLKGGESESSKLCFADLVNRARRFADFLRSRHLEGERVMIMLPSGPAYIVTFLGCLYAGVVAIPLFPVRNNRNAQRVISIAEDSGAVAYLTTAKAAKRMARQPDLVVVTDSLEAIDVEQFAWEDGPLYAGDLPDGDDLAYLQYTSGSTGSPKGVMVSHANVVANVQAINRLAAHTPGDKIVTWLPLFHDMGLVYGVTLPIYYGIPCVMMAPVDFLQRPLRWVQAISRYRGTHTAVPNFALGMAVSSARGPEAEGLDLSSLKFLACGSEPIRFASWRKFRDHFASFGLSPFAFCPAYGLAESTLEVASVEHDELAKILMVDPEVLKRGRVEACSDEAGMEVVCCGRPAENAVVRIVDPATFRLCDPGQTGEIWVQSPSVAQGYWERPVESAETFQARILPVNEGPFLRTGDLGFWYKDELYIAGRLKDLIIIRGLNFYPQDIEAAIQEVHEAIRPDTAAAFSVTVDGVEQLVVMTEVKRSFVRSLPEGEVVDAIRFRIAERFNLQVYAVVLTKPGGVLKTTSGKVQRRACKLAFEDGKLAGIVSNSRGNTPGLPGSGDSGDGGDNFSRENLKVGRELKRVGAVESSESEGLEVRKGNKGLEERSVEEGDASAFGEMLELLRREVSALTGRVADEIDPGAAFLNLGLDSASAVRLSGVLEERLGRSLSPVILYDYPSIDKLAAFLAGTERVPTLGAGEADALAEPVAIVGMACRFPGAESPAAFWQLLRSGKDAIRRVPDGRWDGRDGLPEPVLSGGFLDQVDGFDSLFFGLSPKECQQMDPQQRLLLEVAWEALENAGMPADGLAGSRTGVFVGISTSDYARLSCGQGPALDARYGTGNSLAVAANRLSYFFDFCGPSFAVDTACSSSLVAIHQAMRSLLAGESAVALAGGVNLILSPDLSQVFFDAGMLSPDSRCKTFDASANGYVRGEGCGMLVLKRLSDAVADGDPVVAVIRGSAVNQDGRSNGLTAPNGLAQQAVLRDALANAGLGIDAINFVEAHGTGTSLGDPIETEALNGVFSERDPDAGPLHIGAVKSQIGHLEAAAGVAGVIKTALALQHGFIPGNLHLKDLNPGISLTDGALEVVRDGRAWPSGERRIAGVSSFGFGGTNAHLILEAAAVREGVWAVAGEHDGAVIGDVAVRDVADRDVAERDVDERNMAGVEGTGDFAVVSENAERGDGVVEMVKGNGRRENGGTDLDEEVFLLPVSAKSEAALGVAVEALEAFLVARRDLSLRDVAFSLQMGRGHFEFRKGLIGVRNRKSTEKEEIGGGEQRMRQVAEGERTGVGNSENHGEVEEGMGVGARRKSNYVEGKEIGGGNSENHGEVEVETGVGARRKSNYVEGKEIGGGNSENHGGAEVEMGVGARRKSNYVEGEEIGGGNSENHGGAEVETGVGARRKSNYVGGEEIGGGNSENHGGAEVETGVGGGKKAVAGNEISLRLSSAFEGRGWTDGKSVGEGKLVFLFTGQGSQFPGMGKALYRDDRDFRESVDVCAGLFAPFLDLDIRAVLFAEVDDLRIHQTKYTQACLFTLEFALAKWWMSRGILPDLVIGHSIGEYVAACIAGIFELEDAVRLVAERGSRMQALELAGGMAAIYADESVVRSVLADFEPAVVVAAVNSPGQTVISGVPDVLDAVCLLFEESGSVVKRLKVSHAFHSPLMEPMLDGFREVLIPVSFSPPRIPFVANVSGKLESASLCGPAYWVDQIREAVRFGDCLSAAVGAGASCLLEIGPRPALIGMAEQVPDCDDLALLPSLHPKQGDFETLLSSLGRLYEWGWNPDWEEVAGPGAGRKVVLPNYPFERKKYWLPASSKRKPGGVLGSERGRERVTGDSVRGRGPEESERKGVRVESERGKEWWRRVSEPETEQEGAVQVSEGVRRGAFRESLRGEVEPDSVRLEPGVGTGANRTEGPDGVERVWMPGFEGFVYRTVVGPERFSWVADHRVRAAVVLPGAYYLAVLLGVGMREFGFGNFHLQGIRFLKFCDVGAGDVVLQFVFRRTAEGGFQVTVFQHLAGEDVVLLRGDLVVTGGNGAGMVGKVDVPAAAGLADSSVVGDSRLIADSEIRADERILAGFDDSESGSNDSESDWNDSDSNDSDPGSNDSDSGSKVVAGSFDTDSLVVGVHAGSLIYSLLAERGIQMGASFQWVRSWASEGDSVSGVLSRPALISDFEAFLIHPCLIDACFQLLIPTAGADDLQTYVPAGIDTLRLTGLPGDGPWEGAVSLLPGAEERPRADLQLSSEAGNGVLEIKGFESVGLSEAEEATSSAGIGDWFYRSGWVKLEGEALNDKQAEVSGAGGTGAGLVSEKRSYFLFIDAGAVGEQLASRLAGDGHRVVKVFAGAAFSCVADGVFVVRPFALADFERLFAEAGLGDAAVVLYLWKGGSNQRFQRGAEPGRSVAGGASVGGSLSSEFGPGGEEVRNSLSSEFGFGGDEMRNSLSSEFGPGGEEVRNSLGSEFGFGGEEARNSLSSEFGPGGEEVRNSLDSEFGPGGAVDRSSLGSEFEGDPHLLIWGQAPLFLVKALAGFGGKVPVSVFGFTWGLTAASLLHEGVDWGDSVQALVRGLAKAVRVESPGLGFQWVDLVLGDAVVDRILALLARGIAEPELVLTADGVFVPRLSRVEASDFSNTGFSVVRNGTYLITGGSGGLGLKLAASLADRGVEHLVLVSRNVSRLAGSPALEVVMRPGCQVHLFDADIADADSVRALFERVAGIGVPLKGVLHAAGVLDDATLAHLSWEQCLKVFAPKVRGTELLWQACAGLEPDFFVCFSSVASLFGSAGQANHVMANAFMDAFASQHPGVRSLQWGIWSEVGVAARKETDKRASAYGLGIIDPDRGVLAFERAMAAPDTVLAICPVDWEQFLLTQGDWPFLADFKVQLGASVADGGANGIDWPGLPVQERLPRMTDVLRREVNVVLGFPDDEVIPARRGFFDLGVDSLMAVELAKRIQAQVGVKVNSTFLFKYTSIEALAEFLVDEVAGPEPELLPASDGVEELVETPVVAQKPAPEDDLALIAELSEAELSAMIDDELNNLME